jgi:hypothetical protein
MSSHTVVVRPVRFTDRMDQMRGFLETLGLRARVESERGGWVDMVAGAGMVALHTAESSTTGGQDGETHLSFEGLDLDTLTNELKAAGFPDATVWDEAYGRVLSVTDPLGDQIWVDGYDDDTYGFRVCEPERDARLSVMPVRFADPLGPMRAFLAGFGLAARAGGPGEHDDARHFAVYGGHTGLVALHPPLETSQIIAGPGAVQLGFVTQEPLAELAARLTGGGYRDAVVRSEVFGQRLDVTDPDGQPVIVRPAPADSP